MTLDDLLQSLFVPSEGKATARAQQRNLTPAALAQLISTMRSAPEGSIGNAGFQQNPADLSQAAGAGTFEGDRMKALLALLSQRRMT